MAVGSAVATAAADWDSADSAAAKAAAVDLDSAAADWASSAHSAVADSAAVTADP